MFLEDRKYIENKYHDTTKPFDAFRRRAYHGWKANEKTGLTVEEIKSALAEEGKKYDSCSHEVKKSSLIGFVLKNTQIEFSSRDYFPLIYTWDREISSQTTSKWESEMHATLSDETKKDWYAFCDSNIAVGWADFDHVVPDWDALVKLGFTGIRERARDYRKILEEKAPLTEKQTAYFDGIEIEYTAVIDFVKRLYDYVVSIDGFTEDEVKKEGNIYLYAERLNSKNEKYEVVKSALYNLSEGAPQNIFDCMMLMYLYFMISESVDCYQVRSLGNGIDQTLYGFYKKDLENGTFTREQIKESLRYFFMQWQAIGNYWGQPMYMGGSEKDGTTKINPLSYDIIDVYAEMGIYNPKIQIKYNSNIPKDFLNKVLDNVRNNVGSYVFSSEPSMIKAIMNYGATEEEARDFDIRGCYETGVRGNEVSSGNFYVNMLKCVEYVFSNGYDRGINKQVSIKTGNVEDFIGFEDFYNAYCKQLEYILDRCVDITNEYERFLSTVNPSSLYSATIENSLRQGKDAYQDGAKFCNSATLCCGFATAIDSLMGVKYLVYDKKEVTLSELKKALESNWVGYEKLRLKAKNNKHKYGNNDAEADGLAIKVAKLFTSKLNGRKNSRGGVFKPIMHTAKMYEWEANHTFASADGRLDGAEMSKNASPSIGADKNGATALILSALKLDPTSFVESFCVDLMLLKGAVSGDDGLDAMKGLIDAYCLSGGQSVQFNVFDKNILLDAKKNPEKYQNLQVRVCGWNVLWNNLSEKEQNAYIERISTQI